MKSFEHADKAEEYIKSANNHRDNLRAGTADKDIATAQIYAILSVAAAIYEQGNN